MMSKPATQQSTVAAHADPCSRRRDAQRQTQEKVREGGPALRGGVTEQDQQRHRRQGQRQPIEHPGARDEAQAADDAKRPDEPARKQAGGQGPLARARVQPVQRFVEQAVEGHRGAAGEDAGQDDPGQDAERRRALGRHDGRQQGERQRENRMFETDHPQRQHEATPK
jgi:hypothetical protein